ncbi:ABC transporter ATP-binding protein [Pseudoalteromonas luteoviolacea]|uniref:ABC transporter n=1 Tax=Pseudoalteromonas luteoviolacea S4054 TaxID=1129367 RepID=A0A0F6AH78_9GAMM|nr:ABC transporter ATP-binding protein [Pseudoalteromonas luteoviolacea]AOT06440.1 ABC transporter ATP-binding protein [Pseudoalteromonas luteoviolacea]AOT11357.1 ABC transporter ATP-binding protein [Pseudoalteromonas luteoviolacea]AOT16270.1 ABC transporter ATP-binding protein [Pseudoalteromonas luteoviolacea]KKE85503.1 ABC transporter [Pseudoalteromonas luteoviolacea S4054]KZN73010.1 ABC transporter [Pseudoalteromonas luteoviolacea S4047-1]
MQNIIEMQEVGKVFTTADFQTHALRNISMTIEQGEFVSISGPSGCGKSTLLSLMGLLEPATSGRYLLAGQQVDNLTFDQAAKLRNMHIGFIFQSFNLVDSLSVYDNVALPLRYRTPKVTVKEARHRVQLCLEQVGLSHRSEHHPSQLSGGQQQRVAIARALVTQPSILLVDEATGNLDSKSGDAVMRLINDLHQQGTTICMVTHDPRYADMASRRVQLFDGELLTMINRPSSTPTSLYGPL